MAEKAPAPTRKQRLEVAALSAPAREKRLLGWWQNVHCGSSYELSWVDGKLYMRRYGSPDPYEKPAEAFERLLGYGCFRKIINEPAI